MRTLISLISLAILALGPIACAANTDSANDAPPANASGEDEEIKSAKVITEADQGKTVQVAAGQAFSVQLAGNPTTGYGWNVKSVDKTIGYPKKTFAGANSAVGTGGTERFTWSTKGPFDVAGKHTITFEYQRPWAETSPPMKTFSVTVNVAK